jgi:hypothetical protein
MWYYSLNNQPVGPVSDETIQSLVQNGTVSRQTLVWKEGMGNWQTIDLTELAAFFPPVPVAPQQAIVPPPTITAQTAQPYMPQVKSAAQQIKELNYLFTWFWVCLLGMLITFGASGIASAVLFCIIIYRCWALIQDGYARTTPGKAIGFCFIPFYNFYWIFQAFPGLATDTNAFMRRRGLPIAPLSESLPTTYCVMSLLDMIPYVNYVTAIVTLILMIIMLNRFKNTAVSILQYTQQ